MDEFKINSNQKYFFIIVGIILVFVLGFYNYCNLRAHLFYKKAQSYIKPKQRIGKIEYYRKKISTIKKAISWAKDNSKYYSYYARIASNVTDDRLGKDLGINEKGVEKIYKKAIKFNPTNAEYYFKLGDFYNRQKDSRAEEQLLKVYQIYPTYTGGDVRAELSSLYLDRSKKYLKQQKPFQAFKSLLKLIYYRQEKTKNPQHYAPIVGVTNDLKKIGGKINAIPELKINFKTKKLEYISKLYRTEYNLKTEGFPRIKAPLIFRIYIKDLEDQVFLYRNNKIYKKFYYLKEEEDFIIYQCKIKKYPGNVHLNDFKIRTKFYSLMDKIEIIKEFKYQK